MSHLGWEIGGRPAIEVEGLRKSYGDWEAVRGIDLCIAAGEVFCLLGPNGAGKTTTVEILEGFRSRSAGTVRVLGFDPAGQPLALRQRLGIVLQQCALPGELKVAELVDAYRSYYRTPLPRRTLLSLVELEDDAGQLVRNLSGGQQRRVDLALALAGDPQLVFLDEPTTGFDPAARRRSWNVIGNLAGMGKTIVLTTHYLDEAQQLADRIAVVVGGRIIACDSPQRLADRHVAPTRINFEVPAEKITRMPITTGVSFESRGDHVTIEANDPGEQLEALLSWARTEDLTLGALSVSPPSLEDTYLRLVGDYVTEEAS